MNHLKALIEKHKSLDFPEFPEDDDFAEWVSELSEADGYYIGIAVSALNKETKLSLNRSHIEELENGLKSFSSLRNDVEIYQKCSSYLSSLKLIVSSLK